MVATPDLGAVAARALLAPPRSSESVDVVGPTYSERVVAAMLGATLGRDLHVALIPQPDRVDALVAAGFQPHIAPRAWPSCTGPTSGACWLHAATAAPGWTPASNPPSRRFSSVDRRWAARIHTTVHGDHADRHRLQNR